MEHKATLDWYVARDECTCLDDPTPLFFQTPPRLCGARCDCCGKWLLDRTHILDVFDIHAAITSAMAEVANNADRVLEAWDVAPVKITIEEVLP